MPQFKKYKLIELVEEERGISYGVVQPGTFLKEGVPFIRVNNLTENKLSIKDVEKIATSVEAKYKRTRLKGTELLVSLVGSLGHIGYVKNHMIGWNVARAVGVLPIKEEYDRDWIYWHLKSPEVQGALYNSATTSVQATINLKELQEIEINYPNETYRRKATSILSSLDDKIELNRRTNHTLEQIAQTLFKKYFVDDIDPENLPEGWRWGKVGDVSFVQNGYAFKSNDFKDEGEFGIIKIKNINNNVVDIHTTQFVLEKTINSLDKKFQINSADILIAMTGAEVGKIGIVPFNNKSLWLNQRVGKFQEKIFTGNMFTYLLLTSESYQEELQTTAMGSAQPNISGTDIENIKCIVPSEKLIIEFGKEVKPMFERICRNLEENITLSQIRDSLLPKLMSGEIEVNIAEKELVN